MVRKMPQVDKPLPNTLVKNRRLKTYLLERLGVKRPGRFSRVGAETYVSSANFVMREVDKLRYLDTIRPTQRHQSARLLLNANKLEQLHLYNRQRSNPELNVTTVSHELARHINSLFLDWLAGEMHSHPSRGKTFTIVS